MLYEAAKYEISGIARLGLNTHSCALGGEIAALTGNKCVFRLTSHF